MKFNVDKIKVGERIFNIRNKLNLTLEQFGKLDNLKASKSIVLRWENGTSLPNRSRLEIIAKKGNITVNELLYGSPEEFLDNNIDILFSNLDNNTGFFKSILDTSDVNAIKVPLHIFIDVNNLSNIEDIFKRTIDDYFENIKDINTDMIKYLRNNQEISINTYNTLFGGGFFKSITTCDFYKYLNERELELPINIDLKIDLKEYNNLENLEGFLNLFNNDFINIKFKDLLESFYLTVKDKQTFFNGTYDEIYFISIDFETFKNITVFYSFENSSNREYTIPYKPNKFKITGFNDVIGLYMNDTDTTYFLANYKDKNCIPLNTEAKYFILNHDNTYKITKITEIPNCKYFAPIIGKLE